ncbi:MAG TPA: hypothetical protein IAD33_02490 [Candidatus Scatomorpha gallistercoris]|nr:hypothetical protein [Candidatus Scatomorpha gallistercoris]
MLALQFLLVVMPVLTVVTLIIRRPGTRRSVARVSRGLNLAASAMFLGIVVGVVYSEGVDFYEGFGIISAVVSTFFAAVCAAAEAHSAARLSCEAESKPYVPKRLRAVLVTLAVFAAVTALELLILQGVAEAAYAARQRPEDANLYGLLAAAVAALAHVLAAGVIFALTPGAGKPRVKACEVKGACP